LADPYHLSMLINGVVAWNQWRQENKDLIPDLRAATLQQCDLRGYNFREADFSGADLSHTHFSDCTLYKAKVRHAWLTDVWFSDVNLDGATFSYSNLSNACFKTKLILKDTYFNKSNLSNVEFGGAHFSSCEFIGAIFNNTNLSYCTLWNCTLRQANFRNANLERSIFAMIDLSEVEGLEAAQFGYNSSLTIGIGTIIRSKGNISEAFLHGAGVPQAVIETLLPLIRSLDLSSKKEDPKTNWYPFLTSIPHEPIPSLANLPVVKKQAVAYQLQIIKATFNFYLACCHRIDELDPLLYEKALQTIDHTFVALMIDFEEGKIEERKIEHFIDGYNLTKVQKWIDEFFRLGDNLFSEESSAEELIQQAIAHFSATTTYLGMNTLKYREQSEEEIAAIQKYTDHAKRILAMLNRNREMGWEMARQADAILLHPQEKENIIDSSSQQVPTMLQSQQSSIPDNILGELPDWLEGILNEEDTQVPTMLLSQQSSTPGNNLGELPDWLGDILNEEDTQVLPKLDPQVLAEINTQVLPERDIREN
jgi:uncharacterized protein YjbI with pentapeptide repeats